MKINISKEDAGHFSGFQGEKKEEHIVLYLRSWPSRSPVDFQNI